MAPPEDSANAIFTIVAVSNAATGRVRKGFSSHFLPWCNARTASQIPREKLSSTHLGDPSIQSMRLRKSVNPFTAEFFSQAVLRRLGIRTAPVNICSPDEARSLPADFVVKIAGDCCLDMLCNLTLNAPAKDLTWNPSAKPTGWCLASRLVRGAATLDYISRNLIKGQNARTQVTQVMRQCAEWHATKDNGIDELIAKRLEKTCIPADKFFSDFKPTPEEIERIRPAMALDGPKYLAICAARIFLGCSAPHFSNVLVTKEGELISLDHARMCFEDGTDLRELFYFVNRNSKAFKILDGVIGLTESDIRRSVDEIPEHPACGSKTGLADYYCKRLNLWKELHAKSDQSHVMEMDPRLFASNPIGIFGQRLVNEVAALLRR